jgi:hypothetical protein
MKTLIRLALGIAACTMTLSACASMPPAANLSSYQISFEHFEAREMLAFKQAIERDFPKPAQVDEISGASGHLEMSVATRASSSRVYDRLNSILRDRGYDPEKIKVTSVDGGRGFVIDRIVDDGYRPAR